MHIKIRLCDTYRVAKCWCACQVKPTDVTFNQQTNQRRLKPRMSGSCCNTLLFTLLHLCRIIMNESKSKVLAMSSTTVTGTYSLDNVLVDKAIIGGKLILHSRPLERACADITTALPPGNKPVNITPHGTSSWATTARVECEFEVQHADGSRGTRRRAYFVKIMPPGTDEGAQRVLAEFISMDEIHRTLPSIAPRPLGYGKCALNPDAHYFVCEFLDIKQDDLPDPVDLGKKLAELHRKSESPTGMFGFTHDTYDGKFPLKTKWDSSWTSFFTKLVLGVYQIDTEVNGLWKELEDALNVTAEKIIP